MIVFNGLSLKQIEQFFFGRSESDFQKRIIKKPSVKNRIFQRASLNAALFYRVCSFTMFYIFYRQIIVGQQPMEKLLTDGKNVVAHCFFF